MGPLRGLVLWALIVFGACATPKELLKDRMSQEHCKQKIAGWVLVSGEISKHQKKTQYEADLKKNSNVI